MVGPRRDVGTPPSSGGDGHPPGAPAADLTAALIAWLATPTWQESARVLRASPVLLSDAAELALAQQLRAETHPVALTGLENHAYLLTRARKLGVDTAYADWDRRRSALAAWTRSAEEAHRRRERGDPSALDELVTARTRLVELTEGTGVPYRQALVDLAEALLARRAAGATDSAGKGHDADLDRAVACVLSACRAPMTSPDFAPVVVGVVAAITERADPPLDVAMGLASRAVEATAVDAQARPLLLGLLGHVTLARYRHEGRPKDLDDALEILDRAVERGRAATNGLPAVLEERAAALVERHRRDGDEADLQQAVRTLEELVRDLPPGLDAGAGPLCRLAAALLLRHDLRPDLPDVAGDLDRALDCLARAAELSGANAATRAAVHARFAEALLRQHARTGDGADLAAAAEHAQAAVQRGKRPGRPGQLPARSGHEAVLAEVLRVRGEEREDSADLERSVALYRTSLAGAATSGPDLRGRRVGLGATLLARFLVGGRAADLDEALTLLDVPAASCSAGRPDGVRGDLFVTGNALWLAYKRSGDVLALERAIQLLDRAAGQARLEPAARAAGLVSLGAALAERHRRLGDLAALRRAVTCLREAASLQADRGDAHLIAVADLADALGMLAAETADRGPLNEAVALLEAVVDRPAGDGTRGLLLHNLAAVLVHRAAGQEDPTPDLVAAERRLRAATVLLSPSSPERAAHLADLGVVLHALWRRTGSPAHLREGRELLEQAVQAGRGVDPATVLRAGRHAGRWAVARQEHARATLAFRDALTAAEDLVRTQTVTLHRDSWLRTTADLPGRVAWCRLAASPDAAGRAEAVLTLERGRAVTLSLALASREEVLDGLTGVGRGDLARRWRAAAAAVDPQDGLRWRSAGVIDEAEERSVQRGSPEATG